MRLRTLAVVPLAVRHCRPAQALPRDVRRAVGPLRGRCAGDRNGRARGRRRRRQPAGRRAGEPRTQHAPFFDLRGQGAAAMVIGNQATAARVAILVPGSDTMLATFFSPGSGVPGGARMLAARARRLEPGTRLAIISRVPWDRGT